MKMNSLEESLDALRAVEQRHPFWTSSLLQASGAGALTREDFRFVFSQYYFYSKNFTRYLAALMANCDNDLYRSRLTQNLWEEAGGDRAEKRHAELFRDFLKEGLGIEPEAIQYEDYTVHFVQSFLDLCFRSPPIVSAAALSLGTEGLVPRLYAIFLEALRNAGVREEHLEFFRIHIGCDDGHAATLESLLLSYAGEHAWFETARQGMGNALSLRRCFFENLFSSVRMRRLLPVLERIQAATSLAPEHAAKAGFHHRTEGRRMYANRDDKQNIEFTVDRIPINADVLDPRMVRIPPGKNNECHRHAHETLMYVLSGGARVLIDGAAIQAREGDVVYVPRWALHQTHNAGDGELRILAVTDFGLATRAFVGAYQHREKEQDERAMNERPT